MTMDMRGRIAKSRGVVSLSAASVLLLAATAGHPARADDAAPAAIEEIVVTAQKRPERLIDVPISVTAMTGAQLADRGIDNVRDLQSFVPNFTTYSLINFHPNFLVRGFNSEASNIGFESGLGIYVDGVFMGRPEALTQQLADVERVEVLLGPQGTLFGKNTTLGAISVTTIRPGDTMQGAVTAEVGNYDMLSSSGYIAGPLLAGTLYGKISGFVLDHSGYYTNVSGGSPTRLQDEGTDGGRAELRFTPTPTLDIALRGDWSQTRTHPVDLQITDTPAGGNPIGIPLDNIESTPRTLAIDAPNRDDREISGASLTATYAPAGGFEFASITAARTLSYRVVGQDADATPSNYLNVTYFDRLSQFTQEFRLISPGTQPLKYVVGAFYFYQAAKSNREFDLGPDFISLAGSVFGAPPFLLTPPTIATQTRVNTQSLAGYVNGSYDVTDKFSVLAGIRYTNERKALTAAQQVIPLFGLPGILGPNPVFADLPTSTDHLSEDDWSPTAGVSYKFAPDFVTYLRYSKGFKSGGWNATLFPAALGIDPSNPNGLFNPADLQLSRVSFKPESIENYELGAKSEWLEHRVSVNLAIFQESYKNIQVSQFVGGNIGYITQNAGLARSRGFELEIVTRPTSGIDLGGSLGYADAHYLRYTNGCGDGCNLDGYRLNSPRLTLAAYAQYRHEMTQDLDWTVRGDYSYRSDSPGTVINPTNTTNVFPYHLGGFGTLDGRLGLESKSGWQLYLWSKNLTNKNYLVDRDAYTNLAVLAATQEGVLYGPPRTFGLRAEYHF
jgi:iron complex outermembrane recepter protein